MGEAVLITDLIDEFTPGAAEASGKEGFRITDDSLAEWAIEKIAKFRQEQKKNTAFANDKIERYRQWEENQNSALQKQIEHFSTLLHVYATEKLAGSKKRSFSLPAGTVSLKKITDYKRDEAALLEWAKENAPEYTESKTTVSLSWAELKASCEVKNGKCITKDGEILPGVVVIESERCEVKEAEADGI